MLPAKLARLSAFFLICTAAFSGEAKIFKKDLAAPHVPDQLIVKFKNGSPQLNQKSFLQKINAQVVQQFKSNGAVLIQLPSPASGKNFSTLGLMAQKLSESPEIEYVEPNWIVHATGTPNDPYYDRLYALNKSSSRKGDVFAQEAWTKTTGSRDVLVAVIDSGVDYSHQDLAKNYWHNPQETGTDANGRDKSSNGIDDDSNGFVDDWRGWNFVKNNNDPMDDSTHGTHCAGTIGAVGNNGVGVVGVNWNVSIVGLKFLDDAGSGTLANAVLAIEYATSLGVHIMNNSWGGDEYSETMVAALNKANAAGILFVVAAGNDANNNDVGLDYPASYPIENVIAVAAIDREGELAGFSNFGAKTVHIAAPGVEILSTIPGDRYGLLDGTSMAAPHVSGAAALIKARFPQLKAREIKARLLGGAVLTPALQGQVMKGLMNIDHSLEADLTPPSIPQNIAILATTASSLSLEWEASVDHGSEKYAYGYEARSAKTPLESESDWDEAAVVPLTLLPQQNLKVQARAELTVLNSSGYIVLRAVDRYGNLSGLSGSVAYTLEHVSPIFSNKGDSLDGLSIEGPWGVEEVLGHGKVLSDSPGGTYGFGKTSTLTLPTFEVHSTDMVFAFSSKYELELGYDFGYVEISTDEGRTWKQIAIFNGARNWTHATYPLSPYLTKDDTTMTLRFRVTSDPTTSQDGWYISDISLFQ